MAGLAGLGERAIVMSGMPPDRCLDRAVIRTTERSVRPHQRTCRSARLRGRPVIAARWLVDRKDADVDIHTDKILGRTNIATGHGHDLLVMAADGDGYEVRRA